MKNTAKKIFAVVIALCMTCMFLTSCESGGKETPKDKRDDLIFGWDGKPTSLDPLKATNTNQIQFLGLVMERLVGFDENTGKPVLGIAKSFETSSDGLKMTFKLQPNVKFHNGEALTSSDVKFSIVKALESDFQNQFVSWIDTVETPDDETVIFNLKHPVAMACAMLNKIFMIPEDYYNQVGSEGFTQAPVGSGPYRFVSRDTASGICIVERNPDYWGEPSSFKKVTFRPVADMAAMLIALEKGEIDMGSITLNEYNAAMANDNLTVGQTKDNTLCHLIFNTAVAPTNNKLLRQAIAYAIDYDAMYLLATGGHFGKASSLFYLDMWGETPAGATEYRYDPEKAKELLRQSGLPLPINLGIVPTTQQNKIPLEAVQGYLKAIDIHFEIEQLEGGAYINSLVTGNFTMSSMLGNDVGITAAQGLDSMLNSKSVPGFNLSRWQNPETDAMLQKVVTANGEEEYMAAVGDVLKFIQDEAMYVTFAHKSAMYAYNKDLNVYLNSDLEINKFSWK